MKQLVLLIMMLLSIASGYAQRTAKVTATYTYYAPETMSIEEAKRTALDRARIQAIADEFGIIVSQSTSTIISNNNGESDTHFFSLGGSDVKGEWIETIGEPSYEISFDNHFLLVKCTVEGKARETVSARTDFEAKPLRNGTDPRFASVDFMQGDDLYLYFRSPVDGHLAVYLLDEKEQKVYCMLPYKRDPVACVNVKANKEEIFFSIDEAEKQQRHIVDEYVLSCDHDKEFNTLYILFSPNDIGKRNGFENSSEDKPDNIGIKEFKQWISKTLTKDHNLQYKEINISISKRV